MTEASDALPASALEAQAPAVGMMECPFCAEQINAKAKKCRYCNEVLDPALRKAEEALRQAQNTPHVYMNAGGGGGAAAASAVAAGGPALRHWGHFWHIVLSLLTLGLWVPVWIILYLTRNKNVFY